jgi:hypothetical protein
MKEKWRNFSSKQIEINSDRLENASVRQFSICFCLSHAFRDRIRKKMLSGWLKMFFA